jgi:hypothetical protein
MELRRGLIRDELELKTYILFILKHFYEPVPIEVLNDLSMDRVANYFEFIGALDDLVRSEMVEAAEASHSYRITVQGRFTLQAVEESLPYSTRLHTAEDIEKFIAKTRRDSAITASVIREGNGYKVSMELSADHGPILKLELLSSDRENADKLVKNFRANAEKIYLTLIDELTRTEPKD